MTVKLIKFILLFKNATSKLKSFITIPYQYDLIKFVEFFYKEGLIQYFSIEKNLKHKIASIKIFLRYFKTFNVFSQLKIISKKISIHLKYIDICKIFEKNSTFVISTNFGLFTILDCKNIKLVAKFY